MFGPSSRRAGARRPGLTLVEVLVTTVVLAIGISAGVRALGTSRDGAAERRYDVTTYLPDPAQEPEAG